MTTNTLLAVLPPDLTSLIQPDLELVQLKVREVVAQKGTPVEHIYFPVGCLISVVVSFENGNTVETELVGRDGYNGIHALLGQNVAGSDMYVQVAGDALRMTVGAFWRHMADTRFRAAMGLYSVNAHTIVGQLAGCIAFHSVEKRLARWLLMVRDRVDMDEFRLTHEFMGVMLGVHRPTVTLAVSALQRGGLIEHRRSHIRIVDAASLEKAACECYGVIKALDMPMAQPSTPT